MWDGDDSSGSVVAFERDSWEDGEEAKALPLAAGRCLH